MGDGPIKAKRKRIIAGFLLVLLVAIIWIAAPVYGFVSHQFGMLQTPFGWRELPVEPAPQTQWVAVEDDQDRGERALAALNDRRQEIGAPSLSAAIVQDGELRWAGATGWADLSSERPAGPNTKYRIGSTSKAITSTLLARAVDAGIVSTGLAMQDCLFPLPNEQWRALTIDQLASHTTGIVGYEENHEIIGLYQSMALKSQFVNSTDSLSVFDGSDLLFEPGAGFYYSSYDFVMLAACLEARGNLPFHRLLDKFVTDPLKIANLDVDGIRSNADNRAQFYLKSGANYRPWRDVDLSHKAAGGGIVSTPSAIAHIGAAWLDESYIEPDTRELFWTPVKLTNGEVNEKDYALGWRRKTWRIERVGEVEHLNHGGISKGSQFWLMVVPEHNLSLAIAMNGLSDEFFDFADVSAELLSIFLEPQTSSHNMAFPNDLHGPQAANQ